MEKSGKKRIKKFRKCKVHLLSVLGRSKLHFLQMKSVHFLVFVFNITKLLRVKCKKHFLVFGIQKADFKSVGKFAFQSLYGYSVIFCQLLTTAR